MQVIVSGPSHIDMQSQQVQVQQHANIQYVQHIQEVQQPPTTTAIMNAIQGLNPHTTAIHTVDPHTGATTIQVGIYEKGKRCICFLVPSIMSYW